MAGSSVNTNYSVDLCACVQLLSPLPLRLKYFFAPIPISCTHQIWTKERAILYALVTRQNKKVLLQRTFYIAYLLTRNLRHATVVWTTDRKQGTNLEMTLQNESKASKLPLIQTIIKDFSKTKHRKKTKRRFFCYVKFKLNIYTYH